MNAISVLAAVIICVSPVLALRGFSSHRSAIIKETVSEFERYLPPGQEIVFISWDQPGANTTTGASGRWSIRLGATVWSRVKSEAHNYPTYGARNDNELARIVIGHELAHHVLAEAHVARYREMVGGDGEECATVLSMKLQGIPLRLYEQDISRRFQMYHWCTWFRKYGWRSGEQASVHRGGESWQGQSGHLGLRPVAEGPRGTIPTLRSSFL